MNAENYFDLGKHSRSITTTSHHAQIWFDRGLNWLYGFNQDESMSCFQKAIEADPNCAIAYWGIAYAAGPFYNMPWEMFSKHEEKQMLEYCHSQLQIAVAKIGNASQAEQALINALTKRFQCHQPKCLDTYKQWDDDFADAMREVYQRYPEDVDVVALFCEAMMTRTPWNLWDLHSGEVTKGADTLEVIEVLEKAMAMISKKGLGAHPGVHHLYIHIWEMSAQPEKAMNSADALRDIQPDGGHLHHMPAHIFGLCGMYSDALAVSEKAIIADRKYRAYTDSKNFYITSMCHDLHMKMHAAMMCGLYQASIDAANEITEIVSKDALNIKKPHMVMTLEGYYSMRMHVLVRFGLWQQIIDEPMPDDENLYPVTTAMYHYAKGVAYATLGQFAEAQNQKNSFELACTAIPEKRFFFNNPALNILAVGEQMLNGELEYHQCNYETAFEHLRQAVILDDNLHYSEPWPWMHPPRHALGALLMEQGQFEEAEQVYRADLGLDNTVIRAAQHPDNVWSLHGFHECLTRTGESTKSALVKQRLELALARSDVKISSSCCCRGKTTCC